MLIAWLTDVAGQRQVGGGQLIGLGLGERLLLLDLTAGQAEDVRRVADRWTEEYRLETDVEPPPPSPDRPELERSEVVCSRRALSAKSSCG